MPGAPTGDTAVVLESIVLKSPKLIQLTEIDGDLTQPVWVNADQIIRLWATNYSGSSAFIELSGGNMYVQETPAEIKQAIES